MNRWSVAALLTLAAGSTVSADVILSNYPPTNDTNTTAGVSSTRRKAMSFSMPAGPTYDITSITLRLQGYTSPSDVAILEIRDHTGSTTAPGTTVVGTFVAPASSNTAAGDFVFMPSGAVTLLPGTSYWIYLYAGDATNTFDWRGSSPAIVPTGIATYGGQSLFSTTSGSTWTTSTTINTFSIDGVPSGASGACCLSSGAANCVITSAAGCAAQGGTYQGDGSTCATANCPPLPTGACCRNDGTCDVVTQNQCTTTGGTYAGNNVSCAAANCPPAGACCFFTTCSTVTLAACTAQGGAWLGAGSACGSCPTPYAETGDAGDLPATAQSVNGSGTLIGITGTLTTTDADMFKINICNAANFRASTANLTTFDTQLFLFRPDGTGVTFNDDNPAPGTGTTSTIGSSIVGAAGNGEYYLAISQYDKDPLGATTSGEIWLDTPFNVERAPDGPAAAEPVGSWSVTTGTGGTYGIQLSGACYLSAGGCYANCDGSTGTPLLTANDFQCFLNKYAANDTYANCDGSTGNPLLTANDFQCFLNKYAAGCT